jgi:hypothetical protein
MLPKLTGWAPWCALAASLAVTGMLLAGPGQARTALASPVRAGTLRISPGRPYLRSIGTAGTDRAVTAAAGRPRMSAQSGVVTSYLATAWMSAESGTATGTLCLQNTTTSTVTSNCTSYSVTSGTYSLVQVVYDSPGQDAITSLTFAVTATGGTTEMQNPNLQPSLLETGSFEGGSSAGWARKVPSGATVNMALYNTADGAPATAHDGTGYLATNTNTGGGGVQQQDIPLGVFGQTSYVATAWLSSQSGAATGKMCLAAAGSSVTNCVPYSVTAGTYTPVQLVYDLPSSASSLTFEVLPAANGGTTDLDTVSLVASQLQSGSFENGSYAGWAKMIPSGATVNMALYNTADGAPATSHDGTGYLATNTGGGGGVYADASYGSGSSFTATAWLSSQSGTATGSLCLWGLGTQNTDSCQPYTVTAGAYTQVQVVYDIPADDVSALRVQIYAGQGTTDLDTVSLVQNSGTLAGGVI